jgi:hypothetical protein
MLPVIDVSQGVCGGGSSHGGSRLAPVFRANAAARAAVQSQASLAGRSAPVAVAGARGRTCGRGAAGCASAAAALASPLAAASGDCLSRQILEFGYDKHIEDKYEWGHELGKVRSSLGRSPRGSPDLPDSCARCTPYIVDMSAATAACRSPPPLPIHIPDGIPLISPLTNSSDRLGRAATA